MYQAKSGVIPLGRGGGGVKSMKIAQNGLKHILILELLNSDEI